MQRPEDQPETDLADVAQESPEESIDNEQEALGGDQPDVGGTVPPDQAQSAHDPGDQEAVEVADDDSQPLLGGMMSSDRPESSVQD